MNFNRFHIGTYSCCFVFKTLHDAKKPRMVLFNTKGFGHKTLSFPTVPNLNWHQRSAFSICIRGASILVMYWILYEESIQLGNVPCSSNKAFSEQCYVWWRCSSVLMWAWRWFRISIVHLRRFWFNLARIDYHH